MDNYYTATLGGNTGKYYRQSTAAGSGASRRRNHGRRKRAPGAEPGAGPGAGRAPGPASNRPQVGIWGGRPSPSSHLAGECWWPKRCLYHLCPLSPRGLTARCVNAGPRRNTRSRKTCYLRLREGERSCPGTRRVLQGQTVWSRSSWGRLTQRRTTGRNCGGFGGAGVAPRGGPAKQQGSGDMPKFTAAGPPEP